MSSSDDDIDPRAVKGTQSTMKSLFASDSRTAKANTTSLKYEGKSKKDDVSGSGAASQALGQQPPSSGGGGAAGGGTVTAAQAAVQVFRGDQSAGVAVIGTVIVNSSIPMVVLVDREQRPLARVRCTADLQLLQNESAPLYATLYDPAIGQHWTLQFKSAADCRNYVTATATVVHYVQLADGPVEPFQDIIVSNSGGSRVKKGDKVAVSLTMWVLQRIGGSNSAFFTLGKIVEEIPPEAPRTIAVGQGATLIGVEDLLVGMGEGGKRLGFLSPKKTKSTGIGNPEIGPTDSVVVLLTVHSVAKGGASSGGLGGLDDSEGSDDDPNPKKKSGKAKQRGGSDEDDLFAASKKKNFRQSMRGADNNTVAVVPQITGPPAAAVASPTTAPAAAAPVDQNTLIQTMLLQTLLQQQQQKQQETVPPPSARPSPQAYDLDRGLDRIYQHMFALTEKLDRLDIEGKIAQNNQVLERMVKKAVGKMPVNDVDVEDMAKDRDQLLAKIEHLKHRVEESTDNYHKALEMMGTHKDQVVALKNDLSIERETSTARIRELTERKRLEQVDAEVKYRRDVDKAKERAHEEGLDEGFRKGFAAGKLEALQLTGTTSADEWKVKQQELEQQIVDAESRYQQQASKNYQERRELLDQIASLNSLIKRLEARETTKAAGLVDTSTSMCKTLRRAMNSCYASIESQFYAAEKETVAVEDALAMVLVSIKSETRTFVEEIKREGALIASAAANNQSHQGPAGGGEEELPEDESSSRSRRNARDEAIAAYTSTNPTAQQQDDTQTAASPSSAAMDAYQAMRAEIEAYQTQRDAEQRDEEVRNNRDELAGGSGAAGGSWPPPPPLPASSGGAGGGSAFDINSLPLPPLGDDDEDERRAAPPPPPPFVPQSTPSYYRDPVEDDEEDVVVARGGNTEEEEAY